MGEPKGYVSTLYSRTGFLNLRLDCVFLPGLHKLSLPETLFVRGKADDSRRWGVDSIHQIHTSASSALAMRA